MHAVLIVMKYDPAQNVQHVRGTKLFVADCGHTAHISPSGWKLLHNTPDVIACCAQCVPNQPVEGVALPPGAVGDLNENLGPAVTEAILSAASRYFGPRFHRPTD